MNPKQCGEESRSLIRQPLRAKGKESILMGKDYETLCLNQSELKHMHAIRPYCSRQQQRKSTRREGRINQSPYQMTRSNSKRLDSSSRKSEQRPKKKEQVGNKQMSEMLSQLINLKSQYKVLKGNYTKILGQKKEEVLRQQKARKSVEEQLQRRGKEVERLQKNAGLLESQIDRIRKECSRVLEMERFKMKKLQETLQQKELMIAYLRNQVECLKRNGQLNQNPQNQSMNQALYFLQNSAPMLNFSYFKPNTNLSVLSSIPAEPLRPSFPEEDSLSLSRDKSKQADSIIHSFLSNDQSIRPSLLPRKEGGAIMHSLEESPIEPDIQPISEKSEVSEMDFKKGKEPKEFQLPIQSQGKIKPNHKKLQILIADQNMDTQNIPKEQLRDELSMQTKKKMTGNSSLLMCKQKKKLTAKKVKPF